jgi:protocatechuate 3,4-dioxygenase alpha subunit
VTILARGLLQRLVTRIYFGDEPEANAADPVLAGLAEADRATLVAAPADGGYAIDFRLQGDRETVFFRL